MRTPISPRWPNDQNKMKIVLFASGSTGNCTLVSDGDAHILIDAGISARRIRTGLQEQGLTMNDVGGVLITHEHSDHIRGLTVLLRRSPVPVYALPAVASALRASMPEHAHLLREIQPNEAFAVGTVAITPFCTPHDAAASCGYRFEGASRFGFCTDLGMVTDTVREALRGVDCAVIEANHDLVMLRGGPYPAFLKRRILSDHGHLSNDSAGELAAFLAAHGTQCLILGHLSRENNTPGKALETVACALREADIDVQPALYAAPEVGPLAVEIEEKVPCCL